MKKRFLVAAMACAVALGGFAGFVNAEEGSSAAGAIGKAIGDVAKGMNGEASKELADIIANKVAPKEEPKKEGNILDGINASVDANVNKKSEEELALAKKIEDLAAVVRKAVYVNYDKNATEEEVAAYAELYNLLKANNVKGLYQTYLDEYYTLNGVYDESLAPGIPGKAWDYLSAYKRKIAAGQFVLDRVTGRIVDKTASTAETKKETKGETKGDKKALPNTAAVR